MYGFPDGERAIMPRARAFGYQDNNSEPLSDFILRFRHPDGSKS